MIIISLWYYKVNNIERKVARSTSIEIRHILKKYMYVLLVPIVKILLLFFSFSVQKKEKVHEYDLSLCSHKEADTRLMLQNSALRM